LIPGFLVPVFEDLDFYAIEKAGLLEKYTAANIHKYVDYIFKEAARKAGPDISVGFKWRIWGDVERIADVLLESNVLVFNLVRADLLESASSMYLSDVVNKDFNAPQFLLRDAETSEARDKILFKYRMQMHNVDTDLFFALLEEQVSIEQARFQQLDQLRNRGCEVVTIFYEDFSYKRFSFLNSFLLRLGHPPLTFLPVTKIAKVSGAFPSELFINRNEILASPRLLEALNKWGKMVPVTCV